ncbi:MAG: helicase-related protein [bacterium]|nr:helicase-related protein [bacterium]
MRLLVAQLPFSLTEAQERAAEEILSNMAGSSTPSRSPSQREGEKSENSSTAQREREKGEDGSVRPMQRLLNGDVGSGKTIVAAIAAASVARAGFQVAYLAPTEVLAVQQVRKFTEWFRPLGIHVALWTRTSRSIDGTPVTPSAMRSAVRSGEASIVIGTHAILTDTVRFHALGLAIVDEQHRFGVEQRACLRAKASGEQLPHLLSMTATPIPRTLSLSMFGDLDVSVLDELPLGREPVHTVVVGPGDRLAMTREIRGEIDRGHQTFVVCPQIDVEEGSDAVAVAEALERAQRAFPGVPICALHGRMRKDAQAAIMEEFASRRIAVLVATTVIEVGVDQPNATVMVVEDAERFGLAQLHQLRGRVGRGSAAGNCFLTTRSDDPGILARLQRVADCADGFRIAEMDLEERGPGAVIGTSQSGWPAFRHAAMDRNLYQRAQRAAAAYSVPLDTHAAAAHLE